MSKIHRIAARSYISLYLRFSLYQSVIIFIIPVLLFDAHVLISWRKKSINKYVYWNSKNDAHSPKKKHTENRYNLFDILLASALYTEEIFKNRSCTNIECHVHSKLDNHGVWASLPHTHTEREDKNDEICQIWISMPCSSNIWYSVRNRYRINV